MSTVTTVIWHYIDYIHLGERILYLRVCLKILTFIMYQIVIR